MNSIISTFFGLVFPHTVQVDDPTNQVYILLYELYSAVKTVVDKQTFLDAISSYNNTWTVESLVELKEPLIMVVSGSMRQQSADRTYLGDSVEEKFHLRAVSMAVIPCIPFTANKLKKMIHPNIAPIQLEEGLKEGYFLVNLSAQQDFQQDPEFHFFNGYQPQGEADDLGITTIFSLNTYSS
ncbi:hypothetical protein BD408DRAFT_350716 [Parasitella parasitica]|nr:hypothetical protein BD408DRAFT_350716 [Parasitella parasitica]